jgi:acylphosphatase
MKKGRIIRVYGKVQNVGFRFYTVRSAEEHRIMGFVRNEPDGSVYIEAEGEEDDLEIFTAWCRTGPKWARVDRFDVIESPLTGFQKFTTR